MGCLPVTERLVPSDIGPVSMYYQPIECALSMNILVKQHKPSQGHSLQLVIFSGRYREMKLIFWFDVGIV